MSKIFLTNLGIVLTEKCNFKCKHCMRAKSFGRMMDEETMKKIFNRISFVGNFNVCGGEPFIDENLFHLLISNIFGTALPITSFSVITNGTCYTESIEAMLDDLARYINMFFPKEEQPCKILLSLDEYHGAETRKVADNSSLYDSYLLNIRRLLESRHFVGFKTLDHIFDAGSAKELTGVEKIAIKPINQYYYEEKDRIVHGPMLTILADGIVSECDGEFEALRRDFNYGNVNDTDLEEIIKGHALKLSKKEFERKVY